MFPVLYTVTSKPKQQQEKQDQPKTSNSKNCTMGLHLFPRREINSRKEIKPVSYEKLHHVISEFLKSIKSLPGNEESVNALGSLELMMAAAGYHPS